MGGLVPQLDRLPVGDVVVDLAQVVKRAGPVGRRAGAAEGVGRDQVDGPEVDPERRVERGREPPGDLDRLGRRDVAVAQGDEVGVAGDRAEQRGLEADRIAPPAPARSSRRAGWRRAGAWPAGRSARPARNGPWRRWRSPIAGRSGSAPRPRSRRAGRPPDGPSRRWRTGPAAGLGPPGPGSPRMPGSARRGFAHRSRILRGDSRRRTSRNHRRAPIAILDDRRGISFLRSAFPSRRLRRVEEKLIKLPERSERPFEYLIGIAWPRTCPECADQGIPP